MLHNNYNGPLATKLTISVERATTSHISADILSLLVIRVVRRATLPQYAAPNQGLLLELML